MTEWGTEPATDKQKRYLTKLGKEYSPFITKGEASKLIDTARTEKLPLETEEQKRFEAQEEEKMRLQDEAYERESWFEDWRSLINDHSSFLKQKKMSKKLFRNSVEALEAAGLTREHIQDHPEAVFDKAADLDRTRTPRDGWRPSPKPRSQPKRGGQKREKLKEDQSTMLKNVVIAAIFLMIAYWLLS